MRVSKHSYFPEQLDVSPGTGDNLDAHDISGGAIFPLFPSDAEHCILRNKAREMQLTKSIAN